jgi:hypothetical protein
MLIRSRCRNRGITLALIVLSGLIASARRAEAGCHVADPPRILGALLDRIERPAVSPEPFPPLATRIQLEKRPCRGEIPVSTVESVSPPAASALAPFDPAMIPSSRRFAATRPVEDAPPDRPGRLDRPPRSPVRARS